MKPLTLEDLAALAARPNLVTTDFVRVQLDTGGIAVNALGHAHPKVAAVICKQAHALSHTSNMFFNAFSSLLVYMINLFMT